MADDGAVVVIGGSSGLGRAVAEHYAAAGRRVVVSSRSADRAAEVAAEIGGDTSGVALDLSQPETLADALAGIGPVAHLVLAAIDRDENTVKNLNLTGATALVTLKLVGYAETVSTLLDRLGPHSSIVIFGGVAKDRPYPGSTFVSTVNGGVVGMLRTLTVELAPIRVNAIHPGVVGDSPYWKDKPEAVLEALRSRTPTGQLVSMVDVVDAVRFLLENRGINGINLVLDGGILAM